MRKIVSKAWLVAAGAAAGALLAWPLAHVLALRDGQLQLLRYAQRTLRVGELAAAETRAAVGSVRNDKLPFCSDQELNFMRQIVFEATYVKDMGHAKDGKLYCTADVGRIKVPVAIPKPDIATPTVNLLADTGLMISPQSRGIVAELNGISVVINPKTLSSMNQPPMFFDGFLLDRPGNRVLHGFGEDMPISSAEVVAQRLFERDGAFYRPLCSDNSSVCIVAQETRAAMMSHDRANFAAMVIGGGLLGGCMALIAILAFSQQETFQRRLRRAIRKGELTVAYQPIVDLETERIVGAEALARWRNTDGEVVPPDVFVEVAEERGFVVELTRLMVTRVIDEMGDLLRGGDFRVTVNATTQDLGDERFFTHMEESLSLAGIRPGALCVELTERSTANQALVTAGIGELRARGHEVYIDDFGTGYSSLAYLHTLDVDAIKIDRSFTRTVGTEAVTASVVPQILDIAEQLRLRVVVEGIETREQLDYFRHSNAGILGQGWLFGAPMPAGEFLKRMESGCEPVGAGMAPLGAKALLSR